MSAKLKAKIAAEHGAVGILAARKLRIVAALQGAVEVSLSHERDPDSYRESLEVVLDEARYLSKLANGLLLQIGRAHV